ncbi:UMP-CMP kinase 3 [Raphanus sativus]|nr:UMP-CMP kinase 3 [Raphanus sativus]
MGSIGDAANKEVNGTASEKKPTVIFVLGGPGSGKGTQCAYIVDHFGYTHLSAGDLLRAEIKSGSENGTMIQNMIKEGKIVPSEVTIKLLQKAIQENGTISSSLMASLAMRRTEQLLRKVFVLFFDCPEEEMERRLLGRNRGEDDNIETIRKRFKVFLESSLPVIQYYEAKGKFVRFMQQSPLKMCFRRRQSFLLKLTRLKPRQQQPKKIPDALIR